MPGTIASLFGTIIMLTVMIPPASIVAESPNIFDGKFFRGQGDIEYLQLLDIARRMFSPDPEFQSVPMLYAPEWNGLSEGPRWNMWWIQNSYGFVYCALPFLDEPYTTFLENSNAMWFDQMGDNSHKDYWGHVGPDGVLCDAAAPKTIFYKQGDGQVKIHDWCMGFTTAGLLMQSELLLIARDPDKIAKYLPRLERIANFIDTRRDPKTGLMLAGPAGNLLAPSYAGYKKPDGTYDKAYLAELSVTYIAALDRLIEVEKLAGRADQARTYAERRDAVRKGLPQLLTPEGYFVRSIDPDSTKHGIFGAKKHGYFESSVNHDAICFGVVDDATARRIYAKIAAIPQLRPHDFIIPNYPGYDDMYEQPAGIWEFGRWVNGGHWATCEARMIMAYYRLGEFDSIRRSMKQLLKFARPFRMDAPLTKFGDEVWFTDDSIHLTIDAFGPPAAMVRGLFEYKYAADSLTIIPHIPPAITWLEQRFPIRFGEKRLMLSLNGAGPIQSVQINGEDWKQFDPSSITFSYDRLSVSGPVRVNINRGSAGVLPLSGKEQNSHHPASNLSGAVTELDAVATKLATWRQAVMRDSPNANHEFRQAQLTLDMIGALGERRLGQSAGRIARLSEPAQSAADHSYIDAAIRLYTGLLNQISRYERSNDADLRALWTHAVEAKLPAIWINIRSEGREQTLIREADHRRMSIDGGKDTSCGWAYDLIEPPSAPAGGQLVVEIGGSAGAKFFVDLMTLTGGVAFQTGWTETPTARTAKTFSLPAVTKIGRIILYTMTPGGKAYSDFYRVAVVQTVLELR